MKKLFVIVGLVAASLLSSCAIFVRTPHGAAGAAVGSAQPVHHAHAAKIAS